MKIRYVAGAILALSSLPAVGAQYSGMVALLEVWKNGNVAFSLVSSVPTCNQQFILNKSDAGTKNQYAALLAAKAKGTPVAVYTTDTCIAAENYGGSYNEPLYIYVMD